MLTGPPRVRPRLYTRVGPPVRSPLEIGSKASISADLPRHASKPHAGGLPSPPPNRPTFCLPREAISDAEVTPAGFEMDPFEIEGRTHSWGAQAGGILRRQGGTEVSPRQFEMTSTDKGGAQHV